MKLCDINLLENVKEKEIKDACKGIFWRGSVSSYVDNKGNIGVRKSLRLLKRKSCPGCQRCGWVGEYLAEDIYNEFNIDYIGKIENGKLYTYEVHTSQGYEDLYPEIDCIEFVEVEEK